MSDGRVRAVCGPAFQGASGVTAHIEAIARYSRHDVLVVPSVRLRPWLARHTTALRYYRAGVERLRYFPRLDVVHSHVDPWFCAVAASVRSPRVLWVHTYHAYYHEDDYGGCLSDWQYDINRCLRDVASRADVRISVSSWLRDMLLEELGIASVLIPNGCDVAACRNAESSVFIERFGVTDYVLWVGRDDPVKDPEQLSAVVDALSDVLFVVIGRGLNRLRTRRNVVTIDELSHRDLLCAMAGASALLSTSRREGLPTAVMEAMALSRPVVVPDTPGCRELVHDGVDGYVYEYGQIEDCVASLRKALSSNTVGFVAADKIAEQYDWRRLVRHVDAVYEGQLGI